MYAELSVSDVLEDFMALFFQSMFYKCGIPSAVNVYALTVNRH